MPFDDSSFDVVVSNWVFEQVQKYPDGIRKPHRVLKSGGIALHLFPPRWKPVEPHVHVPLAGVLQGDAWLRLWAHLGVRNEHQAGMTAARVVELKHDYCGTTPSTCQHDNCGSISRASSSSCIAEDVYLRHSPLSKARASYQLIDVVPWIRSGYSLLRERVVVTIEH
ncbi:MAG: methyltransferase domain-containing protein [Ideonella sp.]|nr:methyltransferase domain-containing protein [Ideonella sp.]